ncbi:MAG: HIT family protein [Candidatus Woesearchaeota archaeon]
MEDPAAIEEKLKSMSPEELKEFQKKNCIFCHIISGKVQSKKVYEDDVCTGVLDINPANPGHILLVPNEHYAIMPMMPDDVIARMFQVAKHLSQSMLKALKAQGTNIFVANGVAAGQKAQHFMIHIIPRMPDDGVSFSLPQKQLTDSDMDEIAKRIRNRLNDLLGIKEEPQQVAGKKVANVQTDLDAVSKIFKNG